LPENRIVATGAGACSGGEDQRRFWSAVRLTALQIALLSCRGLLDEVAKLFAQAAEDSALGHADRVRGHAQLGGDGGRRLLIDGRSPERLPGLRLEFAANLSEGATDQVGELLCLLRVVRLARFRLGHLQQTLLRLRTAGRLGLLLPAAAEGEHLV